MLQYGEADDSVYRVQKRKPKHFNGQGARGTLGNCTDRYDSKYFEPHTVTKLLRLLLLIIRIFIQLPSNSWHKHTNKQIDKQIMKIEICIKYANNNNNDNNVQLIG